MSVVRLDLNFDLTLSRHLLLQQKMELSRLSIGTKVFDMGCFCNLDTKMHTLELRFKNVQKKRRTRRNGRTSTTNHTHTICIKDGTLRECIFYLKQDEPAEVAEGRSPVNWFLGLNVKKDDANNLAAFDVQYRPQAQDPKKRFIILEFRHDLDLRQLHDLYAQDLVGMDNVFVEEATFEKIASFAPTLIMHRDSLQESRERDAFLAGKPSDQVLLVYPFAGDTQEIESAAKGLNEARGIGEIGAESDDTESEEDIDETMNAALADSEANSRSTSPVPSNDAENKEKSKRRAHFVTISVEDAKRLAPGQWLNDTLVDFWMMW